jgi:hypothetical protein
MTPAEPDDADPSVNSADCSTGHMCFGEPPKASCFLVCVASS